MTQKQDLADILEQQIDGYSLTVVLDVLSEVCGLKAEHIAHNWQDTVSAKAWETMARRIDSTRAKSSEFQI